MIKTSRASIEAVANKKTAMLFRSCEATGTKCVDVFRPEAKVYKIAKCKCG